jgi:hypothetical protein
MMKTLLVLLAGCCFAGAALAQQYKWVDKDGRTQYGDNPPPGVKATPLRGAPAAPSQSAPAAQKPAGKAPTAAEKDAEFKKRQADEAKAKEKQDTAAADADAKKLNCANAQEAVRTLEIGRVRRVKPDGEYYFLDDAQIAEEMTRAKKSVADFCT